MTNRFQWTALLCIVAGCACLATISKVSASPPSPKPASKKLSPFEGKWQVSSVTYQMAGPMFYTFRGNSLTIEHRFVDKRSGVPQRVSITNWNIAVDATKSPARLTMTMLDETGKPKAKDQDIQAFEFRNGELWMCRDYGDPISPESLRPGGNSGWLTGLTRIE